MASFKNIAWENGADVSVELTIEDLSEGDSVMLFEDREFEQRTVAGFKDGILDQLIVLEDGREVDQHKLSDGDGSRQGGDLYAVADKD